MKMSKTLLKGRAREVNKELTDLLSKIRIRKIKKHEDDFDYLNYTIKCFDGVDDLKGDLLNCLRGIDNSINNVSDLYELSDTIKIVIDEFIQTFAEHAAVWSRVAVDFDKVIEENDKRLIFKIIKSSEIKRKLSLIDKVKHVLAQWQLESRMFESIIDQLPVLIERVEGEIEERIRNDNLSNLHDIEQAKTAGMVNGMLKLYEGQIKMLIDAKKQGLIIESEILEMRGKLLNLEKQENSAMLQELMQTLDSI
jgi:hypothetical protein